MQLTVAPTTCRRISARGTSSAAWSDKKPAAPCACTCPATPANSKTPWRGSRKASPTSTPSPPPASSANKAGYPCSNPPPAPTKPSSSAAPTPPYRSLRDVQPHCSIVCADEDVHLIGMRLLEGFGLNEDNILFYREESEEAVLSSVFHGKACIGFLMAEMFDGLSEFGKQQFRVIMRSAIEDICHLLLLHPGSRDSADSVKQAFLNLGHTPAGQAVLSEFRRPEGFSEAQHEEMETMLDLLTTLED